MELKVFYAIIQETLSKPCYKLYEYKVFLWIRDSFFLHRIYSKKTCFLLSKNVSELKNEELKNQEDYLELDKCFGTFKVL
jgi:hypothetical protein